MYINKFNLYRRFIVGRDRFIEGIVFCVFVYMDLVVEVSRYGNIDVIDKYMK